jgi:hypothetical protein
VESVLTEFPQQLLFPFQRYRYFGIRAKGYPLPSRGHNM